ncbi:MAG: hypothetical protein Ct9H300mP28_05710 [Pseudomonadota bacterium]|nr:MAG: hypothetical protein Ct9H300mP28_05710 [Pseudomonadota bacterium]
MEKIGIKRVVFTDISRDGMLSGPNLAALREMAEHTGLKIVASGGISSMEDLEKLKTLEPYGVDQVIRGKRPFTKGKNRSQKSFQMLAKRIIPCLDIKEGRVVKGTSFVNLRDAGNPLELAQRYNDQSADELVFLDITASKEKRGTTIELATRLARELFIPFTIGGGINSLNEIHALVNAGADKVSVNTAAISNPDLVTEGAKHFGSQCIVVH